MTDRVYEPLREELLGAAARLVSLAFAGPIEGSEKWLREAGVEHVRLARERGRLPAACLLRIPMGQHFGGASVPMLGIAGVAVAPESRGRGWARWMMQHAVREAAGEGIPLAGLYASTHALYRQVGYEQAGHRFQVRIPLCRIDCKAREPAVRPLTDHDEGAIRECYARFVAPFNGTLDRGPYCWHRTRSLREQSFVGFGIDGPDDSIEGYLFLNQVRDPETGQHDVALSDFAFSTPAAGDRLLGFLSDFGTVGQDATFFGGPIHPALSLLDARIYEVKRKDYWMLRILSVPKALEARGYLRHVTASVQLNIHDAVLNENNGSWTLDVEHGRARVKKEAAVRPAISCDVRALASLYSGLYTARQAALMGWVEGEDAAIHAADAIFGGFGTPWMSDMF